MKLNVPRAWIASTVSLLMGAVALAAGSGTSLQSIEPAIIPLGGSAQLTITSIGSEMPAITPPMVPGLEFLAVGQTQQVQIINGVTSARTTVTYQVVPQQAGVFSIPSALPGAEPVVLTVTRGNGAAPNGPAPNANGAASGTQSSSSLPADTTSRLRTGRRRTPPTPGRRVFARHFPDSLSRLCRSILPIAPPSIDGSPPLRTANRFRVLCTMPAIPTTVSPS